MREALPDYVSDVQERLVALKAAGWMLVSARPARTERLDGGTVEVPGDYRLEKYFGGRPIREFGESIELVVARAEFQEKRIAELDNANAVAVRDGLAN